MHIPKSDTQHTEILTFEEAQKHREESAVYDREKWLYIPDFYSEYRYILGTAGKKPLITIGINPSTAEPDNLDNTLKSVERIALLTGLTRLSCSTSMRSVRRTPTTWIRRLTVRCTRKT